MDEKKPASGGEDLDLARLERNLPLKIRNGVTSAFLAILDLKATAIGTHARRVGELCREYGRLGGLSAAQRIELETAALLHDIGFIAGSGWTDEGLAAGVGHYMTGYSILSAIPGMETVAEVVLHHHEHFDGTGRPSKLVRDAIPFMSRIIAVADVYDHEINNERYAGDDEYARRVLAKQRGARLDPDIVNRFLFVLSTIRPIQRAGDNEYEIAPTALKPGMTLSRDMRTTEEVLLLKAGTVLTQDRIDKLLASEKMDWLVTKAYVYAGSMRGERLPMEEAGDGGVEVEAEVAAGGKAEGAGQPKILVLDDSESVCNAIRRELSREKLDVKGATDLESAMKILSAETLDGVITDLVLPGASGFDFLDRIGEKYPEIHAVVLSGFPSAESIHALKKYRNVVRFVTKPWSQKVLSASVLDAVEMTRAERARKRIGE